MLENTLKNTFGITCHLEKENIKTSKVELWKYDPGLFAKDGEVDPVSLAMSLSDNTDERVEGELQSFLEEYKW